MAFLTIFTTPKAFTDPHIATIQRNAIQSWLHLGDEVEVLVIGEEPGMAAACAELGAKQIPDVRRNEQGTPLVSSMFELARNNSQSSMLLCANADILFLPNLLTSAHQMDQLAGDFLLIGRRWDLDIREQLDFSAGWDRRLETDVKMHGQLHAPAGSDYFLFRRDLYGQIPDFAIGRAGWDNWMIFHAREQGWPIVDATPSILAVHQNHDYRHLPDGKIHYELPESQQNQSLAGGSAHLFMILDSDRQLRQGQLQRPPINAVRLLRQAEVRLTPPDGSRKGARWSAARQLRRLRRRMTGSLQ